jgi:hypothetical protein
MGWIGAIVAAVLVLLKGIWGTNTSKKETQLETNQDNDLDSALANTDRLPDPDKLRGDSGTSEGK